MNRHAMLGTLVVVEDNAELRELLEEALTDVGWGVTAFGTASAALEFLCGARGPDAVVLDRVLRDDMSGTQLLDRVRSHPRLWNLPVVMVTGTDLSAQERSRIPAHVLPKPFELSELNALLMRFSHRDRGPLWPLP